MIPTHLLQTGNDIDRSVYEQILQFIRLRVTETYAFPPEIVRVDDITIATLGNFRDRKSTRLNSSHIL